MNTDVQVLEQVRTQIRRRAFRPFFIWLPAAVLLLALDIHLRLLKNTRAFFRVAVENHPIQSEYTAQLSAARVLVGQRVLPGWRTFRVAVDDAEPVEKSYFLWYGSNYLGDFNLIAHKGTLEISADPPSDHLQITSRWFVAASQPSPAIFPVVPVGNYTVTTRYRWITDERMIRVQLGQTNRLVIKPDLGGLDLATQPAEAQFRVAAMQRPEIVVTDRTPAQLRELPAGDYHLRVWRGDYLKESKVLITRGQTNQATVAFEYGQVQLASDPAGATVYEGNNSIGETPKVFDSLKPGRYQFRLERAGYEPAQVSFEIRGDESLTLRTNLVNIRYNQAMQKARRLSESFRPDYKEALASIAEALEVQPADPEALSLKSKLEPGFQAEQARLAKELEVEQARLAKEREAEQARLAKEKEQAEWQRRKSLGPDRFEKAAEKLNDSKLFASYRWTFRAKLPSVREALLRTFAQGPQHRWTVEQETEEETDRIVFQCKGNAPPQTKRHCMAMAWQTGPEEVEVYVKFWDYQLRGLIDTLLSGGKEGAWMPIHKRYVTPDLINTVEERLRVLPEEFGKILQKEVH